MLKSTIGRLAVAVALVALAGPARAGSVSVYNLATGFDNSTQMLLAPNTIDPKYSIVGPDGNTYFPQARVASNLPAVYLGDNAMPGSRWDYFVANPSQTGEVFTPPGNYSVTTTFNLDGSVVAATAQIKGLQTAADDALLEVKINGTSVFSQSIAVGMSFGLSHVQTIGDLGLGDFNPGLNTIEFTVFNQGLPTAFRAVGDVEARLAAVPEPSGLVLTAVGIAYAAFRGHSRRQRATR
jgi:hypothetical protein